MNCQLSTAVFLALLASTQAWDLVHFNPLYSSQFDRCKSVPTNNKNASSSSCDLKSIQKQCLLTLSSTYPLISQQNLLLQNNMTDIRSCCCSTWAFMECITEALCNECGSQATADIFNQQMLPLQKALETGRCQSHTADSLQCNAHPFWLYGSIFIGAMLLLAIGIFAFNHIRARRAKSQTENESYGRFN